MQRRKSKRVVEVYQKYVKPPFREMKELPSNSALTRMHSVRTHQHPSNHGTGAFSPARNSVMDAANLLKETPDVREAILEKSRRIAPAYSKGALQYVTDGSDPKYIGRKI